MIYYVWRLSILPATILISIQSPNEKVAINVIKDCKKEVVIRRFMTRSIREKYLMLKKANLETKLKIAKFYPLHLKWVKVNPKQTVCACMCRTNFKLCFSALNSVGEKAITKQELKSLCLCSDPIALVWDANARNAQTPILLC